MVLENGKFRAEVSPDLMRCDPAGPGCAMDALLAELLLWATAEGFAWLSLGAAPSSGLVDRRFAPFGNRPGGLLYKHGGHYYHVEEGLRAFKQKSDPAWTTHYLARPGGFAVTRALHEINVLVSGGVRGPI